MSQSSEPNSLHLWFPNLFEFKGGIQVYLGDVLQALTKAFPTLNITVHDKLDRSYPAQDWQHHPVSFIMYGNQRSWLKTLHFALGITLSALKQRPKLILCGHLNFAPVAYWLNRFTGIPYWILVYGVDAWEIESSMKEKALQAAAKIISISQYTRDRLIDEQHLDTNQFSLLPVTFDTQRFQPASKPDYLLKRYNLTSEQPIILTVARLSRAERYKGYDKILEALPTIRQTIPNIHYVLVGKGDDRARVEQLITQLGLQGYVTLTGFVPDQELCDHYNLCDVFAMPSKGEGFGIVYLEALACGKPTLGGNQDGAIDALCQGELGALVDPDDAVQIAQTIIQILEQAYPNPVLYQPEKLRQRVNDIYGLEPFQQKLTNLIATHPWES
ncbi:glycosyltransferase [Trichocoleus sp. FACHB-591]|uniref:glycosyltransferase n=1 Tax=Trichocoleus sp. FACHB-591 TaxID=2692872 RepID=UPI001682EA83|nr:glycosyltransferase [Trichocoleus sp. FACHB-591]MBD2093909.1 glycosyltransferase [Trichocoleus sp. FACHB-591]